MCRNLVNSAVCIGLFLLLPFFLRCHLAIALHAMLRASLCRTAWYLWKRHNWQTYTHTGDKKKAREENKIKIKTELLYSGSSLAILYPFRHMFSLVIAFVYARHTENTILWLSSSVTDSIMCVFVCACRKSVKAESVLSATNNNFRQRQWWWREQEDREKHINTEHNTQESHTCNNNMANKQATKMHNLRHNTYAQLNST